MRNLSLEYLLLVATVLTAVATITGHTGKFIFWLWSKLKMLAAMAKTHSRLTALEAKFDTEFGVVNTKLDSLLRELQNNDGSSIKDTLNFLLLQRYIESASRRKLMDSAGLAFWESDKTGACIYASDKLCEVVGLTEHEILGNGWVTNLAERDKTRVFREWTAAVEQRRKFLMKYTFVHANGTEVKVQGLSQPIILHNEVVGFVGMATVIES